MPWPPLTIGRIRCRSLGTAQQTKQSSALGLHLAKGCVAIKGFTGAFTILEYDQQGVCFYVSLLVEFAQWFFPKACFRKNELTWRFIRGLNKKQIISKEQEERKNHQHHPTDQSHKNDPRHRVTTNHLKPHSKQPLLAIPFLPTAPKKLLHPWRCATSCRQPQPFLQQQLNLLPQ